MSETPRALARSASQASTCASGRSNLPRAAEEKSYSSFKRGSFLPAPAPGRPPRRTGGARRTPAPPCGGGLGWGVAPNSNRRVVNTRPQFRESDPDCLKHAVQIAVHILVGKTQNVKSLGSERGRARGVAGDLFVSGMRRPVDLHDDPRVKASEVDDEAAENDLAAEPEAGDLLPSEAPAKAGAQRGSRYGAGSGQGASMTSAWRDPPPCPAPARGAGTQTPLRLLTRATRPPRPSVTYGSSFAPWSSSGRDSASGS